MCLLPSTIEMRVHLSLCHAPTNLREGNVFGCVCLSVYMGVHCTASKPLLTLDLTGKEPTGQGSPASDIWWPSLETCSDLLTSAHPISADVLWLLSHLWLVQVGSTHLTGMLTCLCLFFVLDELSLT